MVSHVSKYRVDVTLNLDEVIKAVAGTKTKPNGKSFIVTGVSTDSREIKKGDLFFAIKGEKFDGHEFIPEALKKGACMAVVSQSRPACPGILVDDTAAALGRLAALWRKRIKGCVIGITGSNGKTTTKVITHAILSEMGPAFKSSGNFNNQIGLPLTLLGVDEDAKYVVLEMGMNHTGEIKALTRISKPDIGLITNVGPVHLEFLEDMEGVAKAKGELFEELPRRSWAVVNIDDERIAKAFGSIRSKKFTYSMENGDADLFLNYRGERGEDGIGFGITTKGRSFECTLPLYGRHNASNAAGAISIATLLGAGEKEITDGLAKVRNEEKRMEIIRLPGEITIVNDCYNANPVSTEAALFQVSRMGDTKYFVFGDMMELGRESEKHHEYIGKLAAKLGFTRIYLVGKFANVVRKGALKEGIDESCVKICADKSEMSSLIIREIRKNSVVLVKGSRGMKMEDITEGLIKELRG